MADFYIDATSKKLGRLASEIAVILQGKKSPRYHPRLTGGDRVFLTHFQDFVLTGEKFTKKVYYRHTGYMGHLKVRRFAEVYAKDPRRIIREAVRRMLPKNFLNPRRMKNLIFVDHEKTGTL